MTKLEKVKNRIIELVPEVETTKPTEEDKQEAVKFIKKNPNKEKYISENFRQFMNGEELDDNSVEFCEEWEEMESLSKHKIVKSCRPITLVDCFLSLKRKYGDSNNFAELLELYDFEKDFENQNDKFYSHIKDLLT